MPVSHHLVIDYVLDGNRPGYQLQQADGLDDAAVKAVWRAAMPRGHGWGDPGLTGARSIKCFPLPGERAAVSRVVATGQVDEHGRAGIRRAEIDIIPASTYLDMLKHTLIACPEPVRAGANRKLDFGHWLAILNRALPKILQSNDQIILTHPYSSVEEWQVMEYIVLYLATMWSIRTLRGWPQVMSLTTLALDVQEESRIVAVPLAAAQQLKIQGAVRIP
jgi:hypothetical protein